MGKRYCSETNVGINQRCGHTMIRAARGGGQYLSHDSVQKEFHVFHGRMK